jgi:hypothetical protein
MADTKGAKGGSAKQGYAQMSRGMSPYLDGGIKGVPSAYMQKPTMPYSAYKGPLDFEEYLKKLKADSCPRCGYKPAYSLPNSYHSH